ncbi:MAG: glycoside hydrolase family 25 protein [Anaerolineales bacterium]
MSFVQGIDVSRWQPTIEWAKVKGAGIDFAVVKASQATFADPLFKTHWAGAKAAGLLRGAYHFFMPDADPMKQVDIYLKTLGDDPGELLPVLDIEAKTTNPAAYAKGSKIWLDEVEKRLGRKAIIYTAAWYWNTTMLIGGKYPEWVSGYPLWVAAYPVKDGSPALEELAAGKYKPALPKSWTNWTFWQYSERGRVDGVVTDGKPANTDLNVFVGSLNDFKQVMGLPFDAAPAPAGATASAPDEQPAPKSALRPKDAGAAPVSFSLEAAYEIVVGDEAPEALPTRLAEAMDAAKKAARKTVKKPTKKSAKKKTTKKVAAKAPAKKAPTKIGKQSASKKSTKKSKPKSSKKAARLRKP